MTTSAPFTAAQQRLVDYVRELARDRGMAPAAALAALRAGIYTGDDAIALGTSELAGRWDLAAAEVEQLAELLDGEPEPKPDGRARLAADGVDPDRALAAAEDAHWRPLACGCPAGVVADEDHQEGCDLRESPRAAFLRGLHELADFLSEHPEVPVPTSMFGKLDDDRPTFRAYIWAGDGTKQRMADIARAMAAGNHRVRKHTDDDAFWVLRDFGGVAFGARATREEVCERVVVGTETVEVEEDACPEPGCGAALTTVDAGQPGREVTVCSVEAGHYQAAQPGKRVAKTEREVVEWRCSPLLASGEGS